MKALIAALSIAAVSFAQSNPVYIPFQPSAVKGVLYKPDSGPAPTVGVLVAHRTSNFLHHIGATELSRRGFLVLAMNPRSDNNEAAVMWEDNALDIKSGVEFLRKQPGIRKVILLGHSGGGPTMTFYQAVAEKGIEFCQGANKLTQCGGNLRGLPPADAIVLMDAHPGNSVNSIRSLHPGLINESSPKEVKAELDPFNPKNGFIKDGASHYSKDFQTTYFKAQADRMNRLISNAQQQLAQMKEGKGRYRDDDIFLVVRGQGARLMEMDPGIHRATAKPQKLLRNDGSIARQIVESVRPVGRASSSQNASFNGGTRMLTLRSFLSANAIRATDSMDGIDYCSSNNSTPCALQSISVPLLVAAMGGHYFIRDNEIHYEVAASKDKDFIVVEGATHGATPCTACETSPGQYSNTAKNFFNYVAKWANERFSK